MAIGIFVGILIVLGIIASVATLIYASENDKATVAMIDVGAIG